MSLLDLIREKADAVSGTSNGRFWVEVDEDTKQKPGNFEYYPLYSAYLFEKGHQSPYPLFAIDSKAGKDYPAEMRVADERGIPAIQITSSDEMTAHLDNVFEYGFLSEHVKLVPRQPEVDRHK